MYLAGAETDAGIEIIYVEDVRKKITSGEGLRALLCEILLPRALEVSPPPEATAVVLFTSGSEGAPNCISTSNCCSTSLSRNHVVNRVRAWVVLMSCMCGGVSTSLK